MLNAWCPRSSSKCRRMRIRVVHVFGQQIAVGESRIGAGRIRVTLGIKMPLGDGSIKRARTTCAITTVARLLPIVLHGRDRHRHEAVDAEDDGKPFDRQDAGRRSPSPRTRRTIRPIPSPRLSTSGASAARMPICWSERERNAVRVRDEHHAHRHEDRGAIEIERVAGRQNETNASASTQPKPVSLSSRRGKTLSDDAVPSTMKISSLM